MARLVGATSGPANGALTYWVNPTNFATTAGLDATALATNDVTGPIQTEAYAPTGDLATDSGSNFSRLTYTSENWTGHANFDEARFGTTLSDLTASPTVTVPAPASAWLLGIGLVGGFAAANRRRLALV